MAIDLEDVGDNLAMLLERRCSNHQVEELAKHIGFKIGSIFGVEKKRTQIRSELAMLLAAEFIHVVNDLYEVKKAKPIIDAFLAKSTRRVFDGLAAADPTFVDRYPKRLAEYFDIRGQEKPLIGQSFTLLHHLNLSRRFDVTAQVFVATYLATARNDAIVLLVPDQNVEKSDPEAATGATGLLEEFKHETSDWPADQAAIAHQLISSVIQGHEAAFEKLGSQLTVSQFQAVAAHIRKLEALSGPNNGDKQAARKPEFDTYHGALDAMVERLKPLLADLFPNDADAAISIRAELLAYAASYQAKINLGDDISQIGWNTFIHSIENRILGYIDERPNLSGARELPGGGFELGHYASEYATFMQRLEKSVGRTAEPGELEIGPLLDFFGCDRSSADPDAIDALKTQVGWASGLATRSVIPKIVEVFG